MWTAVGGLFFYDQSQSKLKGKLERVLSPSMKKRFCGLIRAREYDKGKKFLTEFLKQCQEETGTSFYMVKTMAFTLMSGAIHSLESDNAEVGKVLSGELDLFEKLVCASSLPLLTNALFDCVDLMRELNTVVEKPETASLHARQLVEQTQEYIDHHFTDANLNVSILADQLNVNLSYLSKVFKEATGRNVLDCINSKRAERSKQLLAATTSSIKEIAELSGFYNSNALIRSLKKYEGVTPGQYRNGI